MPRPPSNFAFVGVLAPVNLIWIWGGGTQPQLFLGGRAPNPSYRGALNPGTLVELALSFSLQPTSIGSFTKNGRCSCT